MITNKQYNVLRQPTRRLNIKIDLINEDDLIVGSFEGITIDGNISLSGDSTYRRSGNLTMIFDKKYNLLPARDSKIWLNKRLGVSIGLKNYLDEMIWFNLGRFAISDIDLNFNTVEKTISCNLLDYYAFLDGTLGGELSHLTVIPAGTPISEAIKSLVSQLGKFSIEEILINDQMLTTPYRIEKSPGSTIYEIIDELLSLYMGWTSYFNNDGYFIVEKIRDKSYDSVIEFFNGDDKDFTLSSTTKMEFKNIRNSIYVWGRQLDNGVQIKSTYRNRWSRQYYEELNNLNNIQIGDICHIETLNESYIWDGLTWALLDFKVVPDFNIENIGEKVYSYEDGQIYNENQATLRCEYELGQKSNFAETVSFNIVPLYYLNIFDKIYINNEDTTSGEYLIKSINISLEISSPMDISASKIYN